jgi:titin
MKRQHHGARNRPGIEVLEDRCLLATFVVLNTGDNGGVNPAPHAGTGTLRQAIVDANATAGANTIQFQIGKGAQTIKLAAALPALTGTVVLDGTTQPGFAGVPLIALDGSAAGAKVDGLVLAGTGGTVKGLAVGGFSQNGIAVTGNGNTVAGDYLGTDVTGSHALPNGADGVAVFGTGNTVGGSTAAAGNLISGNAHCGVDLVGGNNVVLGNRIGTDATGTKALGNGGDGLIAYATGDTVGGSTPAAANLVSGNGGNGIDLVGGNDLVTGNRIGTDATGTKALGNAGDGVIVFSAGNTVGGPKAAAGNLISGNARHGVDVSGTAATGNTVEGNRVGTDTTGTLALGNGGDGVIVYASGNTVGGSAAGAGNLISGNAHNGVDLNGDQNVVTGNLIGTDVHGAAALGNGGDGVLVYSSANQIGDTTAGSGNVISGNQGYGIGLVGGSNVVEGDSVGTDLSGTVALGNGGDGVMVWGANNTVGGDVPGAGNLISANAGNGVELYGSGATGNLVQGNLIGTDTSGTSPLGNARDGILAATAGNTIGDSTTTGANTIAFNQGDGLVNSAGSGNTVLQNNVFSNGPQGLQAPPYPGPVLPATSPQILITVPHPAKDTLVQVFDAMAGQELFEFTAFPGWHSGLAVASADMNGDGVPDIVVVSTGRRHGGRVRIIDGSTGQQMDGPLGSFTAFTGVRGGVSISLTDFDGDGFPDLVLTARVGSVRVTKIYSGQTGALLAVSGLPPSRRAHRRAARRHRA